jgi:superfamily II DNA or RNA helicase
MTDLVLDLLRQTSCDRTELLVLATREHYALAFSRAALDDDELRQEFAALLEQRLGGPSRVVHWMFENYFDERRVRRIAARVWDGELDRYRCTERTGTGAHFRRLLASMWEADRLGHRVEIDRLARGAPEGWFIRVSAQGTTPPAALPREGKADGASMLRRSTASIAPESPRVSASRTGKDAVSPASAPLRAIVDSTNGEDVHFHLEHHDFAAWYISLGVQVSYAFTPRPDKAREFAERIIGAALRVQAPMLTRGLEVLRPLRLKDVADIAGHHESTISRVTHQAEIVHHGEPMPVSVLFSNALGDDGEQARISATQARLALLVAIASNPGASDETLHRVLASWGIPLSRRTVAKYREQLGLPSSHRGGRQDAALSGAIARLAPTEWLRALAARRVFGVQDAAEAGGVQVEAATIDTMLPLSVATSEGPLGGIGLSAALTVTQTLDIFARQEREDADHDPDVLPGEPVAAWRTQLRYVFGPSLELPEGLNGPSVHLFDHQQRAIDALRAWWPTDGARGVLCLPTGAGKTRTVVSFLVGAVLPRRRVLWLAHRIELLDQAISTFAAVSSRASAAFSVGRFQAGAMKIIGPTDVVVASIPTLARRFRGELRTLERLWRQQQGFDVVVVDECHHSAARTWRGLIEWVLSTAPQTRILGLSATPTRSERREAALLWKLFGRVIHEEPVPPLIAAGILARPHIVVVPTDRTYQATPDERELFATFDELPPSLVKRIAEDSIRQNAVVRVWADRRTEWKSTLVFAATVAQAADLARRLGEAGARAEMVSGDTTESERRSATERFRRGDLDVLVNCGLFTEGTDLPGVSTVFLARPTRSRVLFQQMVGRAMRGPAVGGSPECNVVAFSDSVHGLLSGMLASTFANEQEALSALGLVEQAEPSPQLSKEPVESADVEDLVRLLRTLLRDWSLDRISREPLIGWWEAVLDGGRRFLPVFDVDRAAADQWVGDLRDAAEERRRVTLIPPPFLRASYEVARQFGDFACRAGTTVKFVTLKDLGPAGVDAAVREMEGGEQPSSDRVLVRGLHNTQVMSRDDYSLLSRAWASVGFLLGAEMDAAAMADFLAYVRGLGPFVATDAAVQDVLAATVKAGAVPAARPVDKLAALELSLVGAEAAEWLSVVRKASASEDGNAYDLLLRLIDRSLERLPD